VYGEATKDSADVYAGYFVGAVALAQSNGQHYILPKETGAGGTFMKLDSNNVAHWDSLQYDDLQNRPITFYQVFSQDMPKLSTTTNIPKAVSVSTCNPAR